MALRGASRKLQRHILHRRILADLDSSPVSSSIAADLSASSSIGNGGQLLARGISSTSYRLDGGGWFDKVKGVFTGKKDADSSKESFSLIDFANQMDTARKLGSLKQYVVGRCSETTMSVEFEKQSAILRYLGSIDPSGENLQSSQKQDAAKHCNCTVTEVENTLARYIWAKDAQKKVEKLKDEGKPLPKSFTELQKMMGSTPLDIARTNMEKGGQLGRNSLCPCGSNKKYKKYAAQNILMTWNLDNQCENDTSMGFDFVGAAVRGNSQPDILKSTPDLFNYFNK